MALELRETVWLRVAFRRESDRREISFLAACGSGGSGLPGLSWCGNYWRTRGASKFALWTHNLSSRNNSAAMRSPEGNKRLVRLDADSCRLVMRGKTRQRTVLDQLTYTVGAVVQEQPLINSMGVGAPRPGPSPTPNAKPKYRVKVRAAVSSICAKVPGSAFPSFRGSVLEGRSKQRRHPLYYRRRGHCSCHY